MQSTNVQSGQQKAEGLLRLKKKKRYDILSTENLVTVKKHPKGPHSGDV